jgi:hypothetical protein
MKKLIFFLLVIFLSVYIIDCSYNSDPVTINNNNGTNHTPNAPSSPIPANEDSLAAATHVFLQWACSDPDAGDTLKYDVYYDKDAAATTLRASDLRVTNWDIGILPPGSYHWRIIAKDNHGLSSGAAWIFYIKNP